MDQLGKLKVYMDVLVYSRVTKDNSEIRGVCIQTFNNITRADAKSIKDNYPNGTALKWDLLFVWTPEAEYL